jgi:hypothetical protein
MSHSQIAKDQIPDQLLGKSEVLANPDEQKKRRDQLLKAVQHNRLFYTKARIVFDTAEETKEVSANIWEVTDNHVMLKGGINLPVYCIREVVLESEVNP